MPVTGLTHITAGFLEKCISVARLKEILNELQDTDLLFPNRVGNLNVNRDGVDIAYIDIGSVSIEMFEN